MESWCSQWADWPHMKCPRAFSVAFYARLPVERRNWMDNPKPEFLWVLTADKNPSPAQTLSILLKPLCESDFEAFFFFLFPPQLCSRHLEEGTDLRFGHLTALLLLWPSRGNQRQQQQQRTGVICGEFELLPQCWHIGACLHCFKWSNLANCSLFSPNFDMIREKCPPFFSSSCWCFSSNCLSLFIPTIYTPRI